MLGLERLKRLLTKREPETGGYRHVDLTNWYDRNLPLFSVHYADLMQVDSRVAFGLAIRNAPLTLGRVKVEAHSGRVGKFVEREWKNIWDRASEKVLRTKCYGYMGYEVMYRFDAERAGLVVFDDLLDRHPRDVRPLTRYSRLVGVRVRNTKQWSSNVTTPTSSTGGGSDLFLPKSLWLTHQARYGQWFGRSALEQVFPHWYAKVREHGCRDLIHLRMMKDAWTGDLFKYPTHQKLKDQDGQEVEARDVARELIGMKMSGGAVALPSDTDAAGKPKWDFVPATQVNGVTPILEWKSDLDKDILEALCVPAEVVQAMESGSGFSGRSIPFIVYALMLQSELDSYVAQIKRQILDPLVLMNFGVAAGQYRIAAQEMVEVLAEVMGGGESSDSQSATPQQVPGRAPGGMAGMFGRARPAPALTMSQGKRRRKKKKRRCGYVHLSQFNEADHPRGKEGTSTGGQFVAKGGDRGTRLHRTADTFVRDGKKWKVGVNATRGHITIHSVPLKGVALAPDSIRIPLDQDAGEKDLIALWKRDDIPRPIKMAVESLHSENRRGSLAGAKPVREVNLPNLRSSKPQFKGGHAAFAHHTLDELQDELRAMMRGKPGFNTNHFMNQAEHSMELQDEIDLRTSYRPADRGAMMVSPHTGPYAGEKPLNYNQSIEAMQRSWHVNRRSHADDVVKKFGLTGTGQNAVGTWFDPHSRQPEGENSIAYQFDSIERPAQLDAAAAALVLDNHQKSVIRFAEKAGGPHRFYSFTIPSGAANGAGVLKRLADYGVLYSTLIPQGKDLKVSVVSTDGAGSEDREKVEIGLQAAAKHFGTMVDYMEGEGRFVGAHEGGRNFAGRDSRADARRNAAAELATVDHPVPASYKNYARLYQHLQQLKRERAAGSPPADDAGESGGADRERQLSAGRDAYRRGRRDRSNDPPRRGRPGTVSDQHVAGRVARYFELSQFDPLDHPRAKAGNEEGGQFVSKDGGTATSARPKGSKKKKGAASDEDDEEGAGFDFDAWAYKHRDTLPGLLGKGLLPGHPKYVEPPEKLYHATFHSKSILRRGLRSANEAGHETLGGPSPDKVSLTTRDNALFYAKAMNLALRSAKGQVSDQEVIDSAHEYGMTKREVRELLEESKVIPWRDAQMFWVLRTIADKGRRFPVFVGNDWPKGFHRRQPASVVSVPRRMIRGDLYYNPDEHEWRVHPKSIERRGRRKKEGRARKLLRAVRHRRLRLSQDDLADDFAD